MNRSALPLVRGVQRLGAFVLDAAGGRPLPGAHTPASGAVAAPRRGVGAAPVRKARACARRPVLGSVLAEAGEVEASTAWRGISPGIVPPRAGRPSARAGLFMANRRLLAVATGVPYWRDGDGSSDRRKGSGRRPPPQPGPPCIIRKRGGPAPPLPFQTGHERPEGRFVVQDCVDLGGIPLPEGRVRGYAAHGALVVARLPLSAPKALGTDIAGVSAAAGICAAGLCARRSGRRVPVAASDARHLRRGFRAGWFVAAVFDRLHLAPQGRTAYRGGQDEAPAAAAHWQAACAIGRVVTGKTAGAMRSRSVR